MTTFPTTLEFLATSYGLHNFEKPIVSYLRLLMFLVSRLCPWKISHIAVVLEQPSRSTAVPDCLRFRHLGEPIQLDGVNSILSRFRVNTRRLHLDIGMHHSEALGVSSCSRPPRKAISSVLKASGLSIFAAWPAFGMITFFAPGILLAM